MSDKITVCGAGGFVGRHITRYLVEKGHEVIAVVRRPSEIPGAEIAVADLFSRDDCERVVRGSRWVINLAATVGGIGYISNRDAQCLLSSQINSNLLCAARDAGIAGYFFASSSCVYPGNNGFIVESDAYPAQPSTEYGWEKLFSERVCLAFKRDYGLPVGILRYHGLYGPGDHRGDPRKDHVIASMCRKVARAKVSGTHEISIWGDGHQQRSFLYIDDCVEGTLKMLFDSRGETGPFDLYYPEVVTVNNIVDILEEIAGIKLDRFHTTTSPGVNIKVSQSRALKSALNWEPSVNIFQGLSRTYREFYDRALRD
jgi:nucleoside-diphosphate-sugar epimerase